MVFKLRRGFFLSFSLSDTPHYENVPFEVPSSWVWCRLDDIVSFQGGYAYKSNTYVNQSDWQVIRIGNVKNDNLILDIQPVFVEDVIGKTTEKYLLKKDDILFTMTGTKGKRDYFYTAKVPSIKKNLLLNQRVGCLRCFSSEINIDFLCLVLKGEYVLDAIFSTETGNVSQGNIGSESTLNLNIAIPPLTEQHRIVVEIEKWFALIDQIEQGKSDLQSTIKQTKSKILDLAIHGKLVPQDPNDEPASELLKRINPNFTPCDNRHYTQLPNGWAVCRLDQVADVLDNLRKPINSNERNLRIKGKQIDRLYPYYGATGQVGLIDDYIVDGHYLLLGEDGAPFLDKNAIKAYSISGKSWVNNHVHILSPKIDFEFLQYSLNQIDYSEYVNGSTRLKLTQTDMCSIRLMLPPLSEQKLIKAKIQTLFSQLDMIMGSL